MRLHRWKGTLVMMVSFCRDHRSATEQMRIWVGVEQPRRVKHELVSVRDAGTSNTLPFSCHMLIALGPPCHGL